MYNVVCLYVSGKDNKILRCAEHLTRDFIPAYIDGIFVKYYYNSPSSPTKSILINEPFKFEYDSVFGPHYVPSYNPTEIEIGRLKLINKKLECIEFLWKSANVFLKTCTADYFHCDIAYDVLNYEYLNKELGVDSLSQKLATESNMDMVTFSELHKVKCKFIYEKKKDIYCTFLESQKKIFESEDPTACLTDEIRNTYYIF